MNGVKKCCNNNFTCSVFSLEEKSNKISQEKENMKEELTKLKMTNDQLQSSLSQVCVICTVRPI